MGVPAFFRWLSKKYPSIIVNCNEEKPKVVNGVKVPVDTSQPNPNDIEFDNLYLDMNGIIHPCSHPEDKPAPKNEDEMMVAIFECIDRLFAIVRPRKLLYMAIDGVAPRAKMNQQRSRRFRASKESVEKREDMARIKEEIRMKGGEVPPDKPASEHFDSNCITPGTEFMFHLAACLRYYIHDRLNNDPGWANIKVILSDANVPGEGEHKIMDYIRRQRAQPDHDPNTQHCLCGADADLIMLGLATHEPNFTIIREEFKPNKPRPCDICGQLGHEMKECTGAAKEKQGEHDEINTMPLEEGEFIFLRLPVLREYLEKELKMTNLPFEQDMERAIDDWVLLCFFVGNDFLPHLPSLEIREGAIDRLVRLYKNAVHKTGGYLTDSGDLNLERVQIIMTELGEVEDEIFKKRRQNEMDFRRRNKMKRQRQRQFAQGPKWTPGGQYTPKRLGLGAGAIQNPRQEAYRGRMDAMGRDRANQQAAGALRSMMTPASGGSVPNEPTKRKSEGQGPGDDSDPEPEDEVKLWEDGWKDRYYTSKFGVDEDDIDFRRLVGREYVRGMCWVLKYYYQGCASWKWYFPYHYAPFASDFVNLSETVNQHFEKNTGPFKPLEQLMSVFPAGSKQFLPPTWQELMYQPESPIIDFYPEDFKIDLNGKKYAWQGVALLPFVEEKRLWEALDTVYPNLSNREKARNIRSNDRLFISSKHPAYTFLQGLYEGKETTKEEAVQADTSKTGGMGGDVWCDDTNTRENDTLASPLPGLEDIPNNRVITVFFHDPVYDEDYKFPAVVLPGAKFPEKTLKPGDFDQRNQGQNYRPQLGFTKNYGYRGAHEKNTGPANRHIRAAVGYNYGGNQQQGGYGGGYSGSRGGYNSGGNYQGGRSHGGGGGGGGGYGNQSNSWSRNMQGQQSAYQQNQQRGYQQGGYGQGGYGQGGSGQQSYGQGGYGGQSRNQGYNSGGYQGRRNDQQQGGYRRY